ncbi:restriction endonuclease subunit S [Trueperella pyogenes]|uniref:restriction endonuclease subunit S n=1 Tax=Trueperella pyogenes TaxID=1661 RepID=UPI0024BFCDF5|nr:restriction endonuclease subunit S [Trueperella pyogenes]WHU57591.1 restriction endonuclease subunit S [Trueperella pyogenes]
MSHIQHLINELCPNGVEYASLGVAARYQKSRIDNSELTPETYVGVDNLIASCGGRRNSEYVPTSGKSIAFHEDDVLLGNIRPYLKKIWLADRSGGCSGDVLALRITPHFSSRLTPDFLYYSLSSDNFFKFSVQHSRGGKMPRGNKAKILEYRIPVPPLEVQREIVRILDGFTKLEAELEAELEARRKQYAFYRDQLLTFTPEGGRTKWLALGEIATLGTGTRNSNWGHLEGTYPFFTRGQEILRQEQYDFDEIAIITAGDGVGVGKVMHYFEGKYALHQRAYRIVIHSKSIVPKFIYHYMRTDFLRYMTRESVHGSVLSVRKRMLEHYPVPVPPLEEQRRIVAILDKFEALVNDISSGLPAEIEARRKQYEHYRDRLLTFPELNG